MKTKFEMSIELAAMKDNELKELVEKLNFSKREFIEEERMLEMAKLEIVRRFLGTENHFIDHNGLLQRRLMEEYDCIWF